MSASKLRKFLLEMAKDPIRAQRFVTDAKVFAKELHEADLSLKEKLAILSRDASVIKELLGKEHDQIIRILDLFKKKTR